VILNIDARALLYPDLVLEFFALRFELLYFLLILFVSGLIAGGLRCVAVRRWRSLGRWRIAAIAQIVVSDYFGRRSGFARLPCGGGRSIHSRWFNRA
jgi:hypothetical protein